MTICQSQKSHFFYPEKAELIERRRKLLAKKEARLTKPMEYGVGEVSKSQNAAVKGANAQSLNAKSSAIAEMAHVSAPPSADSKTERGRSARAGNISES